MANKAVLYFYTLKELKPAQFIARFRKVLKMGNPLGIKVSDNIFDVRSVATVKELDFDPVFLSRFNTEDIMQDKLWLLNSARKVNWKRDWDFSDKSALWNFNLHYFEYLIPLVKAYLDSGDIKYINKSEEIISGWIDANPVGKDPAWASYTISLRIVIWIIYYQYLKEKLNEDFKIKFLGSLHSQYEYLSKNLEKDILGNHYFENLKALIFASLFFKDDAVFRAVLSAFKAECKEEILSDGMQFELSPMYHNIIFEDMLRLAAALRSVGAPDKETESYLQPMLDVTYSFEEGLDRLPLFNDCGTNVAKSLGSLVSAAKNHFDLTPRFQAQMKDSGFYIFTREQNGSRLKLVVDAGKPGPNYIPGHSHCDAMSFELFRDGKPIIVNCGTYAYQCEERGFFRSTSAHNTVMADGVDQSMCWSAFRLAKRSRTKAIEADEHGIYMEMKDQRGVRIRRRIVFDSSLEITDTCEGHKLSCYLHFLEEPHITGDTLICGGLKLTWNKDTKAEISKQNYSEEYGKMTECFVVTLTGDSSVSCRLSRS